MGVLLLLADIFGKNISHRIIPRISLWGLCVAWIVAVFAPRGAESFFGAGYIYDGTAYFFKAFFVSATLAVVWMMLADEQERSEGRSEYFILPWFAMSGMGFLSSANDFLTMFVSLELVTITFYILVSYHRVRRDSLEAGAKYLVLGALSTGFMVYGIAFVFGLTGTLDFGKVSIFIATHDIQSGVAFGILLILVGVAFKVGAAPFHWWVPDVYQGAPTPITAYLSVASKAAGFAILIRLLMSPFYAIWTQDVAGLMVLAAVASILIGNLGALAQRDVKRLMGYSSVSHAGFLLMGLVAATDFGLKALYFYLVVYALATLLVLGLVCVLARSLGGTEMRHFSGLAKRNPYLAWMMLIGMVSLAGLPPTGGFFAKWQIFAAAWEAGRHHLVLFAIFGAVVSLYYYLAIVRKMFFASADDEKETVPVRVDPVYFALLSLLTVGTVVTGLAPSLVIKCIQKLAF